MVPGMLPAPAKKRSSPMLVARLEAGLSAFTARYRTPLIIIAIVVLFPLLVWLAYSLPWTGFGARPNASGQLEPAKTLWDWLELLSLPAVIAAAALSINRSQVRVQHESIQQRDETAVQIAQDDQQEQVLNGYLEHIGSLLLEYHLRSSKPADDIRSVARARTFSALRSLDARRNSRLLQFLREAGLIVSTDIISFKEADLGGVELAQADFHGLDLSGTILKGANLSEADLSQANLTGANLMGTNLKGANLNYADMRRADLRQANLSQAQLFRGNLFTARLESANLSGANLSMGQMKLARLNGADLSSASLNEADCSNAIFFNATMRGANLTDADLGNASLTNADLSGAILTGAQVTQRQLARALSIAGAALPDGAPKTVIAPA